MNSSTEPNAAPPAQQPQKPARRPLKVGPPFWTVASILSLVVNLVLIVIVLVLAGNIFKIKAILSDQLIGGLYNNFVLMDQARIQATIPVSAQVPAKFDLPLETDTTVTLTEDTPITAATVSLSTGGLVIYNAPTDIILPAGTKLPVHLSLVVPVDQQIPVNLDVAVDIPLNQTDLHQPFIGLQQVLDPYYKLLKDLPGSWEEALCGPNPGKFCRGLVP